MRVSFIEVTSERFFTVLYAQITEQSNSQKIYCAFYTLVWQVLIRSEDKEMSKGETCRNAYQTKNLMISNFFIVLLLSVLFTTFKSGSKHLRPMFNPKADQNI